MAPEDRDPDADPRWDTSAATLGHDRHDVPAYAGLAADLREAVVGEVAFDEYAQVLYATDGSVYQAKPAGVVCPRDVSDVRATIRIAAEHEVPVLPRGAGSSLAGQAVGPGCVVLDLSRHMDSILDLDPAARRATVQPGVVQDDLDEALAVHGLRFAPDPASSNRATIGGGIGNNSTGAHSVRYGITDAYIEELQVVLADGSVMRAREIVLDSSEWRALMEQDDREAAVHETVRGLVENNAAEIEARYPDLKRRVSGYNLDKVVYENADGDRVMNLAKLFVGAEGTLGIVVEATVSLVPVPEETVLVVYCFSDLLAAMRAVPEALSLSPSAVELMDDEVFRLAADSDGYARYVDPIPDGTAAALMIEFDSELHDDFHRAIGKATDRFVSEGEAFASVEAYDSDRQADLWKLRKAAIPLLMSLEGDPKPYPFVEDASVPPGELAEYVREFQAILQSHGTSAAYFAHAGVGTLHIRPILNLKESDGVETMRAIAADVTDLVLEHHGSFSGEHGDGLARTEFNPKLYGPDIWEAFKRLKTAFDPAWRLNPGKVVYLDPDDPQAARASEAAIGADMRTDLRYGPAYESLELQTTLDFGEDGFSHLVELCNGCGACRQTGSDVMCPTYRASREEIQTTRGRANMLRAAISGTIPEEELYTDRFQAEVLDLCIGCKGCKSDCPTGVDLAKLKAEIKHRTHQRQGASPRDRLFAEIDAVSRLGSALAPLANRLSDRRSLRWILERVMGIASQRSLPRFEPVTFSEWYEQRGGSHVTPDDAHDRVLLFPDTYTNYSSPAVGQAAVRILETAGVRVKVPQDIGPSGRAAFSTGFLDRARARAASNVERLAPEVDDGASVVFLEPSDASVVQDEYRDLLGTDATERVVAGSFGLLEYIDRTRLDDRLEFTNPDETLAYHGHCHQKALGSDHHAVGVLRRAGYVVDPLDSTCCGMAGSFGYEAEHFELSKAIGSLLVDEIEASDGEAVVAPGASCRTQVRDSRLSGRPRHPIEKVEAALGSGG